MDATIGGTSQYIQYKADFTTSDTNVTAVLKDIVFTCSETGNMAPVIAIDPASQLVCEGENVSFHFCCNRKSIAHCTMAGKS